MATCPKCSKDPCVCPAPVPDSLGELRQKIAALEKLYGSLDPVAEAADRDKLRARIALLEEKLQAKEETKKRKRTESAGNGAGWGWW